MQALWQLFGLRVGWGLISGGASPAMNAMIGSNVSSDMYGRAFGLTTSAMCLGFALGPLTGGLMASVVGLRWPFVVMGVLQLASAVLIWRWVRPRRADQALSAAPSQQAAK